MKKNNRMRLIGALLLAGAMAFAGAPAANASTGSSATCTGGEVSGTYRSLTIAGPCTVPQGATLHVTHNLVVRSHAVFDAQTVSSNVRVDGNVTAFSGSMLGLGCQSEASVGNSAHPCADGGNSVVTVKGNITAVGAMAVLLNGITVGRNVTAIGGGSDSIPWTLKNSTIGGNVTMGGQTTSWIGVMFNRIGGNATFVGIKIVDPDGSGNGMYISYNEVHRNLSCFAISPKVSAGFRPGAKNYVGHHALGQCKALV